jgi:N6-adenosine-specific RNA methylase IME4
MALQGPFTRLTEDVYGAILADPPWHFKTYDKKQSIPHRQDEQPYQTMTRKKLIRLPVYDLAAKDAILFMWVIDSHLDQGLELGKLWGFKYKTRAFEWFKIKKGATPFIGEMESDLRIGMGYWSRKQCESCLLFTKGHPKRLHTDVRQAIFAPIREHSRKPDEIYPRIERLVGGPYVELFARYWRPGWDGWGDELV